MLPIVLSVCLMSSPATPAPGVPGVLVVDESPNLRIAISHDLANCLAWQKVDRCDTFCETILGTDIKGLGRTVGHVQVEFVPSDHGAIVDLVMSGVNSPIGHNVGTNGPVVLVTDGDTLVAGRKRLFIQPEGITTVPATADASPVSNLKRMDTHFHGVLDRLVKRVATDIYQRDRGKGLEIGRGIAIHKLARGFDDDVNPRLVGWNRQMQSDFREPLQKRNLYPQRLHFATDPGFLHVLGRLTDPKSVSVIGPPPPLPLGAHAALWVHQSLPNGQLARTLAGKKLNGKKINDELKKVLGERGLGAAPPPEQDRFEIEFAEERPIEITFAEESVSITLRSLSFTSGETVYDNPNFKMRSTAKYKLTLEGDQFQAKRAAELEVLPLNYAEGDKISFRQQGVIRTLKEQLDPLFPTEVKEKASFNAPPDVSRRVGKFQIERLISQDGWLAIAIKGHPPIVER